MDLKDLKKAVDQIAREKGLDSEKVLEAIESSIAAAYKKEYGKKNEMIRSKFDLNTGELKFWQIKTVVDENTVMATEKTKLYKDWLDKKLITEGEYYELVKKVNTEIKNLPASKTFDLFINIHGLDGIETLTSMGGGGSSGGGFEAKALGGAVRGGQPIQWGEYGRPEMLITPSGGGQVVNAQQIVEAMRSSGMDIGNKGVTIQQQTIYTSTRADLIQYSIERARGYAL